MTSGCCDVGHVSLVKVGCCRCIDDSSKGTHGYRLGCWYQRFRLAMAPHGGVGSSCGWCLGHDGVQSCWMGLGQVHQELLWLVTRSCAAGALMAGGGIGGAGKAGAGKAGAGMAGAGMAGTGMIGA